MENIREDRIQLRADSMVKDTIKKAAQYMHQTMTDFILQSALKEANKVIDKNNISYLSSEDWASFMDALENPPEPNDALKDLITS